MYGINPRPPLAPPVRFGRRGVQAGRKSRTHIVAMTSFTNHQAEQLRRASLTQSPPNVTVSGEGSPNCRASRSLSQGLELHDSALGSYRKGG